MCRLRGHRPHNVVTQLGFSVFARSVASVRPRHGRLLVGIDGPTGSGTDIFARQLAFAIGGSVVPMSDLMLPRHRRDGGDIPVDTEALREYLVDAVQMGDTVRYPQYRADDESLIEWMDVPGDGPIIVEGAFAFADDLHGEYDVTVFVNCDPRVRAARLNALWGEDATDAWEASIGVAEGNHCDGTTWAELCTYSFDTTGGVR